MTLPTKFELNPISGLSTNARKLINGMPGNGRKTVGHDHKVIMPGETRNELVHKIWVQSHQWFVWKCAESAQLIRGQETRGTSMERDWKLIRLGRPIMSWPTKFELHLISSVSVNGWELHKQSEARKQRKFSRAWPKLYQAGEGPDEFSHQISAQSDQPFVWKCVETAWPIRGQETAGIKWNKTKS